MGIATDSSEKTKDNYLVYCYEYKDSDRRILEEINTLTETIIQKYKQLNHKIVLYLPQHHPILAIFSEKKKGQHIELKKLLDSGSIVEWTTNKIGADGKPSRPKEILYIERRSALADATGYMEENLKWTVDIDFSKYVRLDCLRIGNRSILKLSGREISEAQKEYDEKKRNKKK